MPNAIGKRTQTDWTESVIVNGNRGAYKRAPKGETPLILLTTQRSRLARWSLQVRQTIKNS
jgi:hypothetical protein